jgi:hypothetical protein
VKLHPQWIIRPSRRTVRLVGVATLFRSALLSEPPDHFAGWTRNARLSCQRNLVDKSKWRDPVVDHAREPAQEDGEDLLLFIASGYPLPICDGLIDQAFGTTAANKLGSREPKRKYVEGATTRGWTGFLIKKPIDAIHPAGVLAGNVDGWGRVLGGWSQGQPHFPE